MPARLSAIARALKEYGVSLEKPKKGSHWKAVRDGRKFPIPAHNAERTEISDKYVAALCYCFEIDKDEFRAKL